MRRAWIGICMLSMVGCRAASMEHWATGSVELQVGNIDAAVANLEQCKRERPDFAPAYLALAAAKSRQGDFESVAKNLSAYLKLEPQHHVANMYYAECMMSLGRLPEAEEYFQKYLATVPDQEGPHRSRLIHAHTRMAEVAKARKNAFDLSYHEAVATYHRAMEAREKSRLLPDTEAAAQARRLADDLLVDARQKLERVKSERPNDPRVRKYLAEISKPRGGDGKDGSLQTAHHQEPKQVSTCYFPPEQQMISQAAIPTEVPVSKP